MIVTWNCQRSRLKHHGQDRAVGKQHFPFANPEVAHFRFVLHWQRGASVSKECPTCGLIISYPPQRAGILTVRSDRESGQVIFVARPLKARRLPSCFAFAQTDTAAALCGPGGTPTSLHRVTSSLQDETTTRSLVVRCCFWRAVESTTFFHRIHMIRTFFTRWRSHVRQKHPDSHLNK